MASRSVGLLEARLLYPMEWCRNETHCHINLNGPGVQGPAEVGCK